MVIVIIALAEELFASLRLLLASLSGTLVPAIQALIMDIRNKSRPTGTATTIARWVLIRFETAFVLHLRGTLITKKQEKG